jgi:hypothetical protein
MRAQQFGGGMAGAGALDGSIGPSRDMDPGVLNFTDGTITPGMLYCCGYDPNSQVDALMSGNEYGARWAAHERSDG